MTRGALIAAGSKELRALLPTWLGCTLAVVAAAWLRDPNLKMLGLFAYGFGSIALGADSVGHEYSYRTLSVQLSQPAGRRAIYLVKLGVLAALLGVLGLAAAQLLMETRGPRWISRGQVYLLVGLCGLFVTPALTMLCRSSTAGIVFTLTIPGLLAIATNVAGFGPAALPPALLAICAFAAPVSWWSFMRLEAIEGRGTEIHLPQWLRGSHAAAAPAAGPGRHAVWRLVAKELHLHQMAFVLAAIFALGIAAIVIFVRLDPGRSTDVVTPILMVYAGALPFVIGSLAIAEERQFGTLQWQLLLPMAAWRQWIVKAGVAFGLSLAFGVGLPALIAAVLSLPLGVHLWPGAVLIAVLLTSVSLYVSSLTGSGIRALLIAIPVTIGAALAVHGIGSIVFRVTTSAGVRVVRVFNSASAELWAMAAAEAVMAALLVYLAYANHRSAESPATQLRRQAGWIAGLLVLEISVLVMTGVR